VDSSRKNVSIKSGKEYMELKPAESRDREGGKKNGFTEVFIKLHLVINATLGKAEKAQV